MTMPQWLSNFFLSFCMVGGPGCSCALSFALLPIEKDSGCPQPGGMCSGVSFKLGATDTRCGKREMDVL